MAHGYPKPRPISTISTFTLLALLCAFVTLLVMFMLTEGPNDEHLWQSLGSRNSYEEVDRRNQQTLDRVIQLARKTSSHPEEFWPIVRVSSQEGGEITLFSCPLHEGMNTIDAKSVESFCKDSDLRPTTLSSLESGSSQQQLQLALEPTGFIFVETDLIANKVKTLLASDPLTMVYDASFLLDSLWTSLAAKETLKQSERPLQLILRRLGKLITQNRVFFIFRASSVDIIHQTLQV